MAVLATHVTKMRETKVDGAPGKAAVSLCDKTTRLGNERFESKEEIRFVFLIRKPEYAFMKENERLDLCKMCTCHLEHRLVNLGSNQNK